jgi:hypothetical protein
MTHFTYRNIIFLFLILTVYQSDEIFAQTTGSWPEANATVKNEVSVFLKKPEYIGLLGVSSLFTNKLEVVYANYKLPQGARIRLIEKWDTGARGYRYVKFQWKNKGKIREGWTWAGKRPNYWIMIMPDNADNPFTQPVSNNGAYIKEHPFNHIGEQMLSFFVGNAYAANPVGVPTQVSGYDQERQVPGRIVTDKRSAFNFFSLIWTSLFVSTVGFAKDGIKDKFRHRFRRAYLYYSSAFVGITVVGFLEAVVVKAIDAGFFGG